jgi:hypothetical protein
MNDDEHRRMKEAMADLRETTKQYLARELGGGPEDYDVDPDEIPEPDDE